MSDLKRKASNEIDASEEPSAKRPRSTEDSRTMTPAQITNSADAWTSTEEVAVDAANSTQTVPAQDVPTQEIPTQDTPAQITPAQQLQTHGMPSQGVPTQAVAALNPEKRESKSKHKSVEPDSDKSARQLRIESLADPGKNVRERGTVRDVDGDLRWLASDGTLVPCVYHNSIRAELISEASHSGTLSYDVPRRHGNLDFNATDITAYHPEQKAWSEDRNLWSRIRDNILNRLERKQYKELYAGQDPGEMMHNGRLVVDHDNHPIYMFPDLPATISSAVEGWWLEAITRLDSRIDRMDIRARLPAFRGKTDVKKESQLYGLSAIGNKRLRFREREGLIAWDSRVGSDLINQFHKSRLPAGCVKRNTTEGGGPLSPGETKQLDGIKKGKAEHAGKAKGSKNANKKSPSPDNAAGPPAQNFGGDGPAPETQAPAAASSAPPRGQQPQNGPPPFGASGAHTPGFAPQIKVDQPSKGGSSAEISIPRGLTPAQVLGQYQILSNLTGQSWDDFQAAIQAVKDEENAYSSLRSGRNNREDQNGRGTRAKNELNTSEQCSNMQPMNPANERAADDVPQPHNMQRLSDTNSSNKNIIDLISPPPSTSQSRSAAATQEPQPSRQQPMTMHNTIGDEHWVPESEEIDEAFWEETMNKDWSSAVDQGNDQPHLKDARPGINNNGENTASQDVQAALSNSLVPASQVEAPGSSSGENHASLDPLLEDLFGAGDNVVPAQPAVQLEPIQPGAEHFHFSPDPQYDPFAPEDDHVVPTQQILQAEAPQPSDGDNRSSQNPLLDDFFADLVPELTPETLQELGTSLGLSGDFADYQSRLLEQGVPEGNLAPAETATTGSKRKTTDEESSNESKKVRLQEGPTTYTPYQPRQDQRRVPTQQPRPQNHQRLPPYVSSTSAPPLAQGALPNPTATPEKPPTPRSTTLMPPPRRRPPPTNQSSLPPPTPTNARRHGPRSNPSKTPLAQPTSHNPQRHQTLQPYQSHPTPFPASHIVPPKPPTTAPTNTAHPSSSQPTPPSGPHPPQGAPIDHRYTAPTTANQMALIITLLEPTINQFQGLMQGTPFADHIVDTDMAASYMTQHQHIVREMEALWGRMNWDRSALPRLSIVGPISGARWEGR